MKCIIFINVNRESSYTLQNQIKSSTISFKDKACLWFILHKFKQLVYESFNYSEFCNFINVDHFSEIMNQGETFDILVQWKAH